MIIFFIGAPGSGKGAQAEKLKEKYGIESHSVGEVLRQSRDKGLMAKISAGDLLDDKTIGEVVLKISNEFNKAKNYIIDGFPRTVRQADFLSKNFKTTPHCIFCFEAPESILMERIMGRMACKECGKGYHRKYHPPQNGKCEVCGSKEFSVRKDDNEKVLKNRIHQYNAQSLNVKALYENSHNENKKFHVINGNQAIQEVFSDLDKILKTCI